MVGGRFILDTNDTYIKNLSWKPTPEDILAYIYSILHSPIYRKKYFEFLKTDFPSIPMTKNKEIFRKYMKYGKRLIDLHLLKNLPDDKSIKVSMGGVKGDFIIDKLLFANNKINLSVSPANKSSTGGLITFEPISLEIFDFEIGSRKPIDLWIKNRKNDKVVLNLSDLQHIKNMAVSIKQTIIIMNEIKDIGEEYLNIL